MSDLSTNERRSFEKLFEMANGFVLDFSNYSFAEFMEQLGIAIYSERYEGNGTSKAKRLRAFWELENNYSVGRVNNALISYAVESPNYPGENDSLVQICRTIAQRLLSSQPVAEMDSLTAISNERDFEVLAQQIREAIEKNQPEGGLDRLHTYLHKFLRVMTEPHGVTITREKPLHSIFGEYVRALKSGGHVESDISERILKSSISVLEEFNRVRNNQSLAHDNPILNYEESLLIFNHIAALIRFMRSLDAKIKLKTKTNSSRLWDDNIPF